MTLDELRDKLDVLFDDALAEGQPPNMLASEALWVAACLVIMEENSEDDFADVARQAYREMMEEVLKNNSIDVEPRTNRLLKLATR